MYRIETEILFSVIAFLAYLFLLEFFKKKKEKINENILLFLCSIIIIGSVLRVFEDSKIFPKNFLTVTPGIWILTSLLFFPEYLVYKRKKISLRKISFFNFIVFLALTLILFYCLRRINLYAFFCLIPLIPLAFLDVERFLLFFSFGIDSITPAISTTFFNYYEKHPLSAKFLAIHPILYVTVKLLVAFFLYLILNKKDEEKLLLYCITAIVLGAGVRSFLRFLFLV